MAPGVLAGKLAASPRLRTGALGRTLDWAQPAAGADVMATGIVSTGLPLDGLETLSKITLGVAAFIVRGPPTGLRRAAERAPILGRGSVTL